MPNKSSRTPQNISNPSQSDEPRTKKRGRKPRGGKIVTAEPGDLSIPVPSPNVILHLRCGREDLFNKDFSRLASPVPCGDSTIEHNDHLQYGIVESCRSHCAEDDMNKISGETSRNMWTKIEELAVALHTNNISDKKSACFWDTCDFDSPPIHIPKFEANGTYYCYGCFCSPECATAYLFRLI